MSLKNKVVNLFGETNCFNLPGYSLTTLFKNCVVSGCGFAVSRGCNAVFTAEGWTMLSLVHLLSFLTLIAIE